MLLVRSPNTRSPFANFNRDFDRLAAALFNGAESTHVPALTVYVTTDAYAAQFDVPGYKMEQLDITVENGTLIVKGSQSGSPTSAERRTLIAERSLGDFEHRFTLPEDVDADRVAAALEDGVLNVTLPKRPETQPRRIEVKGL